MRTRRPRRRGDRRHTAHGRHATRAGHCDPRRSGLEVTNPAAYQQKLKDLLADRDPIEVLSETPDRLRRIVEEHTTEQLRARPFEGKWTPNEILGHLTDAEWASAWRFRHVLGDERPSVTGYDQDAWVDAQRFNERDPSELLAMFCALRSFNLDLWKRLTPADFGRVGDHSDRGPESLGLMLCMAAGHDLSHLDQITRYLDAIRTQSA